MATKRYNQQSFRAIINGEEVTLFRCYTTDTRSGFCHTAHSTYYDATDTKVSYYNRTWERFDYESVLKRAIEKLPKSVQQSVYDQIIDGKAAEEEKKAQQFIDSFEKLHAGLSDENKARLANSGIEIHSQADAQGVMGLMALMSLTQK